jgi:two-component system chemotaxis response regulator CheY
MNILIIDDSQTTRGLLRRALQQSDPTCSVREAEDGKTAIHELTQGRFDLIVSDLEMPGMDGHRFLEVLKGNPLLRRKKVLVFSASITPQLKQQYSDNPNIAFLAKPASNDDIAQAVQALAATIHA